MTKTKPQLKDNNIRKKHALLLAAVEQVYYAAYWTPDRPCDAKKLWENLRDAAGFKPGESTKMLGLDRQPEKSNSKVKIRK